MDTIEVGDGLTALLEAQDFEAAAVQFPALEAHASALIALGRRLDDPVIWPVGVAAERIAGAASLISGGGIRLREWNSEVRGERVVIFAVVSLTPLTLFAAARHALNMGAVAVEACGLRIEGLDDTGLGPLANFHVVSGYLLAGAAAR